MGLPLKNFVKIKASPPKNSIFFYSTPKEILRDLERLESNEGDFWSFSLGSVGKMTFTTGQVTVTEDVIKTSLCEVCKRK